MSATASADPTLATLDTLNDPHRWIVVESVPVFAPHRRKKKVKGEDGKEKDKEIVVTEHRLHDIVRKVRGLENDSAVIPALYLGHRNPDPDWPEERQPQCVGFARNWRVGKWGPKHKTGILVDLYYDVSHFNEARDYRYRSAEFYDNTDEITGVALLKRDPQLDLGMLVYARDEGDLTLYAGDPDPTLPPKAPPPPASGKPGEEDEPPPDDEGNDDDMDDDDRKFHERFQKCMKRYFGDMGGKGMGSGGAVPPGTGAAPLPPPDQRDTRPNGLDRMQRRREMERLQRLEKEVVQLRTAREEDATRYARESTENMLTALDGDYGEKITPPLAQRIRSRAVGMSHEERRAYDSELRELLGEPSPDRGPHSRAFLPTQDNYSRMPASGARDDAHGELAEDFTQRDLVAAEQYMRSHAGCDWADAEKYALEQKRKRWA